VRRGFERRTIRAVRRREEADEIDTRFEVDDTLIDT